MDSVITCSAEMMSPFQFINGSIMNVVYRECDLSNDYYFGIALGTTHRGAVLGDGFLIHITENSP